VGFFQPILIFLNLLNIFLKQVLANYDPGPAGVETGLPRSSSCEILVKQKKTNKLDKEMNKIVTKCLYKSEPSKRGYIKRMHTIWNEEGLFELSEQKLSVQASAIRTIG